MEWFKYRWRECTDIEVVCDTVIPSLSSNLFSQTESFGVIRSDPFFSCSLYSGNGETWHPFACMGSRLDENGYIANCNRG